MRNKYLVVVIALAACSQGKDAAPPAADASPPPVAAAIAPVAVPEGAAISTREGELPSWQIPNMGEAAEAYYGPDSLHLIAQVRNSKALASQRGGEGFLTTTFTDAGGDIVLVNDKGYDACSYFFPDGEQLIWTSVRDHMGDGKTLVGDWSNWEDYPQGAELYISDRQGGNVKRLTDNNYYEAEVTVSPDGKWIVFGRQVEGNMDLWVMNADGTGEKQITFTEDWQEGAPYFLPDSDTILFRAWKGSEYGQHPTPMTIFTIKRDGSGLEPQTHTHEMNWAPYPAPDGKHFVYVRIEPNSNNWEVYLGEIGAGPDAAPRRLTFDDGFDGFPSISPDGRKLVWTTNRSDETKAFMQNLRLHVMDVSSLGLGPK